MKKILGISAFYHDSAAALSIDGKIKAAAQEERFSRKKNDASFPSSAIAYCLHECNMTLSELDAIVFYDKPFLKFERIIETFFTFSPKGWMLFIRYIPEWIKHKLFIKSQIRNSLKKVDSSFTNQIPILFSAHHLSHAASAYYVSPFEEAAILTVDGVGEWATASISKAYGNKIEIIKEMHFPHSLGLLYSAFTYYLGFKVNSAEYKVMGLAAHGNKNDEQVSFYINCIKSELIHLKPDGSIWLNDRYFAFTTSFKMTHDTKWEKLFGIKRRKEQDTLLQSHINMAMAIQKVTEECMLLMAKEAIRITGIENLCLAGGVALNCVSNQGILEAGICKDIYIQPAAGDAGCSVGAALAAHHLFFNEKRINTNADGMNGAYLGPSYRKQEIENVVNQHSANGRWIENTTELINIIANKLAEGKTVGWFRGRMEFGPRALGNRSILADARLEGMQQRINTSVKFRESFRPFAPIVREEKASEYFSLQKPSPYMLFTAKVIDDDRNLPFENTPKKWRFPATTHVDGTARVQTVNRDTNKHLWHLLHCFEDLTSSGVLLNTSFNIRGEPIVNTPLQAYECFMQTDMDLLVLENMLFDKQLQPLANKDHIWRREFEKD